MDNIDLEPEIKIEYDDTWYVDPLSCKKKVETDAISEHDTIHLENVMINKEVKTWFKNKDASGKYCCKFCELSYSTLQTLRNHIKKKHTTEAIRLRNEIIANKRNKQFKCYCCKKRFSSLNDLEVHFSENHQVNKENYCHICQSVFNNIHILSEHFLSKHKIVLSKLHMCNTCGYTTTKISHFKQHRNIHFPQKSMKCKFCNYETSYLSNLNSHIRSHSNNKPYSCDFDGCLYKTKSCACLKSHKLKHNKVGKFKYCDKCTFKTVYADTFQKHLNSHERNTIRLNTSMSKTPCRQ